MQIEDARRRGEKFAELQAKQGVLVLANPWDAGTARLLERAGFPAFGIDERWARVHARAARRRWCGHGRRDLRTHSRSARGAARRILEHGTFEYTQGLPTVSDLNELIAPSSS